MEVVPQIATLPAYTLRRRVEQLLGSSSPHVYTKQQPTAFKRAIIIGIHGFFPTKMLRPIIGEPKGTSLRFTNVAEAAINSWAEDNGIQHLEIQKIALEKEGKVFDRVDFFFDVLNKLKDDLMNADFIFVCAHSQGCPVSIILLAKLLEYGIINNDQLIGMLCMAGVNLGPFYGLDKSLFIRAYSTIENDSMLELFQFQNFESLQSRKYIESIKNLVSSNIKISFIGSINDQLVPLYSSLAQHIQHPNIFKSVYIDQLSNTPLFITKLIMHSCILQNIGRSDHDFIKEISINLQGNLTGNGHSKIYNDLNVYKQALDFTLKTTVPRPTPLKFKPFDMKAIGTNKYVLSWCAKGLTLEIPVSASLKDDYNSWTPSTKLLKEVKERLSGIETDNE